MKANVLETVLATIERGTKEYPVSVRRIKMMTGVPRKTITGAIRELRKDHPICSTKTPPGGYWIGSAEDVKINIKVLNAEANSTFETANNLSALLKKMEAEERDPAEIF